MEQEGFPVTGEAYKTSFSRFDAGVLQPVPFAIESLPFGWLSPFEASILYNLALMTEGPIVEIGSWVGRSTCALAAGVQANPRRPIFDVFDLGIVGVDDFKAALRADPRPKQPPESMAAIEHPGGVPAVLVQNLAERGLYRAIHMLAFCDFKTSSVSRLYSTAFCDACHFKWEMDLNIPPLMKMMDPDNYLIVFDDVYSLEACDYVAQMIGAEKAVCLFGEPSDPHCKVSLMARGSYARSSWFV
jgi:hypothetical protein